MSTLDLSVFVEFGVGIAGFSGVVVAFGQRSGHLDDYDRYRVVLLLLSGARSSLSLAVWLIGIGGCVLALLWNGLNLLGWPSPLSFGPIAATLVWYLVLASLMFFRLLLVRIGNRNAGD